MGRADHPNDVKRGGVCAYIRESLPARNFSNSYLRNLLTLQVSISNKKCYFISATLLVIKSATLYRSSSQTSDEFDSFISNLEQLLTNITSCDPHFVILLDGFNPKSKSCSVNGTPIGEGTRMENLTSSYGMKQLISAPTHILRHSSRCIDLIFVNQPNLVIDARIHPSLH